MISPLPESPSTHVRHCPDTRCRMSTSKLGSIEPSLEPIRLVGGPEPKLDYERVSHALRDSLHIVHLL